MGMFDRYEPKAPVMCQACGAEMHASPFVDRHTILDFQGKSGPCMLLVWRQGDAEPSDPEGYHDGDVSALRLPPAFTFHRGCPRCGVKNSFKGMCVDGVWTETLPIGCEG